MPYTTGTTPMVLVPAIQSAEQDKRGRFREIFCEVLEARGDSVPDYRPCEDALTHVGNEPAGTGKPVKLGQSTRRLVIAGVPGVGMITMPEDHLPPCHPPKSGLVDLSLRFRNRRMNPTH